DRQRLHFALAADAHVGRPGHSQPAIVVDMNASPFHGDLLAALPCTEHGKPVRIERVVRDLSPHTQDCVACVELASEPSAQIAATNHFMGLTEYHPHTPPRFAWPHRLAPASVSHERR